MIHEWSSPHTHLNDKLTHTHTYIHTWRRRLNNSHIWNKILLKSSGGISFSSSSLCLAILIMMGSITNFILSFECRQRYIIFICNWWLIKISDRAIQSFWWISMKHFLFLSYLPNVKTSLKIKYWVTFGKTSNPNR